MLATSSNLLRALSQAHHIMTDLLDLLRLEDVICSDCCKLFCGLVFLFVAVLGITCRLRHGVHCPLLESPSA